MLRKILLKKGTFARYLRRKGFHFSKRKSMMYEAIHEWCHHQPSYAFVLSLRRWVSKSFSDKEPWLDIPNKCCTSIFSSTKVLNIFPLMFSSFHFNQATEQRCLHEHFCFYFCLKSSKQMFMNSLEHVFKYSIINVNRDLSERKKADLSI